MSEAALMYFVPKQLAHVRTSAATTYHLRPQQADDHRFPTEWALCTVNDATGELTVCSDWGNFTYLWSARPEHLGASSLTHFIAGRGSANYLADKLTSHERKARHRFSPEKTVKHLCQLAGERYRDRDVDKFECKRLVVGLRELLTHDVDEERDFVDRFYEIDGHDKIASEPWECFQHEPTSAYLVLLHSILPALIAACKETIRTRDARGEQS
jgi:hypothetical protein